MKSAKKKKTEIIEKIIQVTEEQFLCCVEKLVPNPKEETEDGFQFAPTQ